MIDKLPYLRDEFKGYFGLLKHNARTLSELAIVEKIQRDVYDIISEVYGDD